MFYSRGDSVEVLCDIRESVATPSDRQHEGLATELFRPVHPRAASEKYSPPFAVVVLKYVGMACACHLNCGSVWFLQTLCQHRVAAPAAVWPPYVVGLVAHFGMTPACAPFSGKKIVIAVDFIDVCSFVSFELFFRADTFFAEFAWLSDCLACFSVKLNDCKRAVVAPFYRAVFLCLVDNVGFAVIVKEKRTGLCRRHLRARQVRSKVLWDLWPSHRNL